ncbi:MAG: hypothetical protein H6Q75_1367 [Firmicutes bacterium]|nr:hypothetical protein [Bacillota bacterium]
MRNIATLSQLVIYRNLLDDPLMQSLERLLSVACEPSVEYELTASLFKAAEKLGLSGNLWQSYLIYRITQDENIFTVAVEKNKGHINDSLRRAVLHDLSVVLSVLTLQPMPACSELISTFTPSTTAVSDALHSLMTFVLSQDITPERLLNKLIAFYLQYGSGATAGFKAFRWEDGTGLVGISHTDTIALDDIIGYDTQKAVLIQNTEAFIAGRPANNVLLAGARGTGKSSSVKALINRYYSDGLRLVEVPRHQLQHLNTIIETLRQSSQKFIIFLDDLSFEEAETDYKYLKSIIDGGIEAKPANVLLYATSNRRHLVKESWSDRADSDDIHTADSVQEKISLVDRFGITITFQTPDQNEFLRIVNGIARRNSIALPEEELKRAALRWEMSRSGRSGRVARQFVTHLLSQKS